MANQSKLKAYVRYDGTGRVIAGGPILQRFKPKVGNWVEIDASECCNYVPTTLPPPLQPLLLLLLPQLLLFFLDV